MNARISAALVAFAIVLALAPAADAGDAYAVRYVAGVYQERGAFDTQGACMGAESALVYAELPVVAAGACNVRIGPGTWLVTVTDDALGATSFSWDAFSGSYPNVTCRLAGSGFGSATLTLPEGCDTLDVYVGLESTTGTITVNPA